MPTTDVPPSPSAPRRRRDESGRFRVAVSLLVVLAVAVGVGVVWRLGLGPVPDPEGCTARVGDVTVDLSPEQARNATVIAAVALRRGLPARAVSIALATAFQESKLRNLDYGDRDSVGLFQQRPSQGWGTARQVQDPYYAANAFYDALEKVDGYQEMRITEAAQLVQRSGFPEAYEAHASGARALASALTGYSPARFTCVARPTASGEQPLETSGLTARAEKVRVDVLRAFGDLPLGGFDPGGVQSGHMAGSAHYDGRAVDIFFRPVNATQKRRGWAVAQYLVAHAKRLKVDHVIFDARIWSSGRRSEQGWRPYRPTSAQGAPEDRRRVLEHRDHVHVDVLSGD